MFIQTNDRELGDFIKGMLSDLLENVLDTALCLIQNILGDIMKKLMDMITKCIGYIERCYRCYQRCKR